jgi:glycyl-tRNA synthetase beta chain
MNKLLIEIGTEEIPAGYIIPALNTFKKNIIAAFDKYRIDHGKAKIFGTPRRLALMVEDLAEQQNPKTSTITGPPEKIGYDENKNPTIAAEKFAAKAGIDVDQIWVEETKKGRYLTAVIEEKCESTISILENMLEKQILSIPFPKSMRWGSLSISFARPIISLVGLFGDKTINFKVGNIKSGSKIFGHQFMNPGEYEVDCADNYTKVVESAGVIPDIDKRKKVLIQAIESCAKEYNSQILKDDDLIDIVTNLVEYPFPIVGRFDDEFLEVPDEVLITAMREHQKCFALTDEKGSLKPLFIAVNNTNVRDMALVAHGHEKVLRARLSDAKFFYGQDCKSSLDEFRDRLKNVTFQEKLGSVYDKTLRIGKLCQYLVEESSYDDKETLKLYVARASQICKADLVSQVVIEFTKLQGVIGRAYALNAGEKKDIAYAVEQHYRPVYSGGKLPENPTATILAIADKLDTICGCFSIGLIPTGGADPYALRRQGIGIIQIMLEENLTFSFNSMIDQGLEPFIDDKNKLKKISLRIREFFQNRMVNNLIDKQFSKEAVNSALFASFDNLPDVVLRVKALDSLRKEPDFEPLATTFKRVENIIKKAGTIENISVTESLFEDACEKQLFKAVNEVSQSINASIKEGNYDKALSTIATLRPKVDTFFDDVMVMVEDKTIKQNRIALLSSISELFKNIANFSML